MKELLVAGISVDRDEDASERFVDDDLDYFTLDDDEMRALRPARLGKAAATHLAISDLTAEIHRLSERDNARITRGLKVRANAPAPVIAQAMRTTLARLPEEGAASALHDALHYGVLSTGATAELENHELAALLRADETQLGFLVDRHLREALIDPTEFGRTPRVRAAVWSSMISAGHDGAVAALAWLIAEPPDYWTDMQRATATAVWEMVRRRLPDLPEQPASLVTLCQVVVDLERTGELERLAAADRAEQSDAGQVASGDVDGQAAVDDGPLPASEAAERLAALSEQVAAMQTRYADTRDTALATLTAGLAAGRVPPRSALEDLLQLADDMQHLLSEVAGTADTDPAATLEQATEHLDAAIAAATASDALSRISRLSTLTAPEYVADEARQVADLAASADADTEPAVLAALDALVTAIGIGTSDPQRTTELARIVQTALPSAAVLVMHAATGALGFVSTADRDGTHTGFPADHTQQNPRLTADEPSVGGGDATLEDPAAVTESAAAAPDDADSASEELTGAAPTSNAELPDITDAPVDEPWEAPSGAMRTAHDTVPEASPGRPAADEPSIDEVLADLELTVPLAGTTSPPAPATSDGSGAPDGSEVNAAGLPVKGLTVDTDTLYAELLRCRQFALAAWLTETLGADPAIIAAHRVAAHAAAMRTSAGPNAAAFADLVRELDADALHSRPGTQMLVYAASVRAGLLSPTAGAAGPLRDITGGIVKCGPAVEELTDALLTTIYSGAHLTPRSADTVAETANLESEHTSLAAAARNLLETASSRTIRYQAATELWKAWMEPTGYLGAALILVAAGSRNADDLKFVRARVTELRSRGTLDTAIDRDTPQRGNRVRRIEARARDKIIAWAGDVADVLAQWVVTTENIAQASVGGGWMAGQITELRTRVNAVRAVAITELQALAGSGRQARNAAVDAGLELLEKSLDLLTGAEAIDGGAEMPADRVLNGPLALAPTLPLSLTPTLTPRRSVTVTDVSAAAQALAAGASGWTVAFNQRTELADQVGTQVLIDVLRHTDSQLARRLTAARDRDVAVATARLDEQVAKLAARIDSDRLFGRLTADGWSELSIRARAFEPDTRGTRRDFDVMTADLDLIEEDRKKQVVAVMAPMQEQMAGLEMTKEQSARIADCIASGDVTTAEEYIETIRNGGELPAPRVEVDHLARFFPAFPTMFAAATSTRGPSPLAELKRAIDAGQNPASGRLADALAGAQIDLAKIGRRPTASIRIEQWMRLAGLRTLDAKLSQVKPVLEQLGFFAANVNTPSTRRGQVKGRISWMYLTGVRATAGKALIPAFGSAISPSGGTLRLLAVWGSPTPGELVELLRGEPSDHSVLVFYFGTLSVEARCELAAALRAGRKLPTAAVVDDAAFAYLAAQPEPRRDITMSITLPFASSAPFTPDVAGLVPVEMFYGRTEELDQVVDMMGSCIVYGGRQLGKSALLRAAAREFDDGEVRHAIYQSIYKVGQAIPADAVWTTLWPRLAEKRIVPADIPAGDVATAVVRHIVEWIAATRGRQLLLLLDESDFFLDADANDGKFIHVAAFRELMERTGRAVKVVFAGLHQTARFERLANHPLAHFGNPVCVGPLTPQHAYDLLTRPLHALGYRFADDNIAARVLALANNQPSLIQLFGAQLLGRLQRASIPPGAPPQSVTSADIESVWSDESLRNSFRKRFDWTLNLDPRYKIIAYSVAFYAHAHDIGSALTPTELRSQCEQWWPQGFAAEDVRTGEFRALLDECVALGVLSYGPTEGAYRLRTPNVLALLGSRDEVDDVLDQAEATPLPESFDGSLLRPAFRSGLTRSPLTSAQIADLLAARRQVRVIAGSAALTVARCARVLRDENEHAVSGKRSIPIKEATAANLANACQQAAMAASNGHAVVLVDLSSVTHDAALAAWAQSRELIAAHTGGTLGIVLITSPAQAPLWVRATAEADASSGLTELHRYDNTGLRLWLTETPLPFQDDASREELLGATGGWPMLVNKVAETLSAERDPADRSDPLEAIRAWLAHPAHADELVDACGVRADDTLRQAWEFLVAEFSDEAVDARTIADLMSYADDAEALRPGRLASSGYGTTDAVVDVLRTLGVLVTRNEDGQLHLEPVVAAAAATAGSALG